MLMSFLTLIDKSLSFLSSFWKNYPEYNDQFHKIGLNRDLNPGPLAPKARIIPLDH